jgi:hypothetical protein
MTQQDQSKTGTEMIEQSANIDPPDGWHWGIGESSSSYYTVWLYTNKPLYDDGEFGWECEIYWDNGGQHQVLFQQITRMKPNGDYEYSYPHHVKAFDNHIDAVTYAISKATELR